MFSRLIKRRPGDKAADASEETGQPEIDDDALLMNEANPERLLAPEKGAIERDMSWLDEAPALKEPKSATTSAASPAAAPAAPPPAAKKPAEVAPEPASVKRPAPNPAASARPRFPYGWLVVVEGAETGAWHVLERGLSQIGSADGQTVRLSAEDGGIAAECHAELYYDEARHGFVLYTGKDTAVRLNGIPVSQPSMLRDGDVIALGGTALRLVALCSQNFSWSAEAGRG